MTKVKNEPVDKTLYEKIKTRVYKRIPQHSAYRSGILVTEYKKAFKEKYGNKSPYTGKKNSSRLARWFKEEWLNQRGEVGYKYKSDVYRPKYRISKGTPTTFSELSKSQIAKARIIKKTKGRVPNFKKIKPKSKATRKSKTKKIIKRKSKSKTTKKQNK